VNGGETTADQAIRVLDALETAGCRVSLEGGWGVDALAGRQTRPHRDLDVDIDVEQEARVLAVLEKLGYRVESDWRPNRVELVAADGSRVDVHPLAFDADGDGVQTGPAGERYVYPAASFIVGTIAGRPVGCLTAVQQIAWHGGYELRGVDHADLVVLRELTGNGGGSGA
jgi:lincosamide nucleotidyltransferase A/C/D/E